MQDSSEDSISDSLGSVEFACRPRSELSQKLARGESLMLIDCAVILVAVAFPGLLTFIWWQLNPGVTLWQDPIVIGGAVLFWLILAVVYYNVRRMRRFAIHQRGMRFDRTSVMYSEIASIEYAHPSRGNKERTALAAVGGRGIRRITQFAQQLKFDRAFDINLKDKSPVHCRFVGSGFFTEDIDKLFDLLRKSHPELFASRELLDTFAQFAAFNQNPAEESANEDGR